MITGRRAFTGDFAVFQYAMKPAPLCGDAEKTAKEMLERLKIMNLLTSSPHKRPSAEKMKHVNCIQQFMEGYNRIHPEEHIFNELHVLIQAASDADLDLLQAVVSELKLKNSRWWQYTGRHAMTMALESGKTRTVRRLLRIGPNGVWALVRAAQAGDLRAVINLARDYQVHSYTLEVSNIG